MSIMEIVRGEDCLQYVDKPIGLANIRNNWSDEQIIGSPDNTGHGVNSLTIKGFYGETYLTNIDTLVNPLLMKVSHNTTRRICGLVTNNYSDGGKRIVIFGNEELDFSDFSLIYLTLGIKPQVYYHQDIGGNPKKVNDYVVYPDIGEAITPSVGQNGATAWIYDNIADTYATFDESLDYNPTFHNHAQFTSLPTNNKKLFKYRGSDTDQNTFTITTNKNNTLTYGENSIQNNMLRLYGGAYSGNPLECIAGNLYDYLTTASHNFFATCPASFISYAYLEQYINDVGMLVPTYNGICNMYNIILTNSEEYAKAYVENGTLPPDAYLFPLDFENLPKYDDPVPTGDEPDDYPDDNNPDDDNRDFDPTPLETPTFTVNQLTNYNWYWLTVPEWSSFINWFWNDIGDFSDFDDIIAKVKGLYNDLASAVIMCRYYPVDVSWIGGTGTQSNIKIGMIEKAGNVDTLANTSLRAQDIGHVHIGQKYKSFMDMSPYSQLSLYLPWHGFIDLDMNLFNGHDVYVKALYDYLSGTIQYYIYYDNELLVNTILCKMAMDIPITLQTKNDRDSAIFNNVSSTIGGLVGAGVGIASGNPIGMVMGVTQGIGAFNSANASAPMRLMGNVGESGAYIGCQNCFVIVRRPTIQPSDGNSSTMKGLSTWKKNVGMLCGYGYTLSDLNGQGFTVCHSPRINFTNTVPLQTEVDEIYDYLSKGVIL